MAQRTIPPELAAVNVLPDFALIDVRICALLLSCSENTVWRRSKAGSFPKPIRVSPQQTRWRVGDVRKALASLANPVECAA
jgi:predicted DNA-binding transcriptional regulator AlpA